MGFPAYIATNLCYLAGAGNITESTADATYGEGALIDNRIDKPFRFTAKTLQWILVDMTAVQNVTCVVILKHNFTSGVTLTLKAGSTAACADYSNSLAYNATNIYETFSVQSYRYWKLEVDDAANSAMPELCEFILGAHVAFSSNFSYGWQKGKVFTNDYHRGDFGAVIAYDKYAVRTRNFQFVNQTETVEGEVGTLFDATTGGLIPFVLIPDLAVATLCMYGRVGGGQHAAVNVPAQVSRFTTGFSFIEESPGKAVT